MPKEKIKTIEDLKAQYPELCEQLVDQGRQEVSQIAQKLVQKGIERGAENIYQLIVKLCNELGPALARGFTSDLAEEEDPDFLKQLRRNMPGFTGRN